LAQPPPQAPELLQESYLSKLLSVMPKAYRRDIQDGSVYFLRAALAHAQNQMSVHLAHGSKIQIRFSPGFILVQPHPIALSQLSVQYPAPPMVSNAPTILMGV
jgi:hypothetical protein